MNRRTYLAALPLVASATAGCLGSVGSPPSADSHPDRSVALSAVDSLPDDIGFTVDAAVSVSDVTERHPAEVVLTATNEGERRDVSVGTEMCHPFNRSDGRSESGGLWLYPADDEPDEQVEGRWEYDADGPVEYPAYGCTRRTWDAGESRKYVYAVWDDFETEGYYEPGTYRWEHLVSVAPPESHLDGEATAEATWAFELTVEDA